MYILTFFFSLLFIFPPVCFLFFLGLLTSKSIVSVHFGGSPVFLSAVPERSSFSPKFLDIVALDKSVGVRDIPD